MAVADGLRAVLRDVAPATSGRLDESGFLLAGATAGLVGAVGRSSLVCVRRRAATILRAVAPGAGRRGDRTTGR